MLLWQTLRKPPLDANGPSRDQVKKCLLLAGLQLLLLACSSSDLEVITFSMES